LNKQYPELLLEEKRRGLAYVWSIMVCLFTPFGLWLIFGKDWSFFAGAIVLGFILSVIAAKMIRRYLRVCCPLCGSNQMHENYYGGRGSKDVAHTCESCGARFDNGTLQD
jgi:membrane protein implicated in regulation of membrane protease activity